MQVAKDKYSMITRRPLQSQPAWKRALASAITDPAELLRVVGLDESYLPAARRAAQLFGLMAPRSFVDLIRPGDPSDPLLRQILPVSEEILDGAGYSPDPVGDRLERGVRYGLIRFGSRTDVWLPAESRALVSEGDRVHGGSSVLAELPGAGA